MLYLSPSLLPIWFWFEPFGMAYFLFSCFWMVLACWFQFRSTCTFFRLQLCCLVWIGNGKELFEQGSGLWRRSGLLVPAIRGLSTPNARISRCSCCDGTSSLWSASDISGITSHSSKLRLAMSQESNRGELKVYVGGPFRCYTLFRRSKNGPYKLPFTLILHITSARCTSNWGSLFPLTLRKWVFFLSFSSPKMLRKREVCYSLKLV